MKDKWPIPLSYGQRQGWQVQAIDLAFGVAIAVVVFAVALCILLLRAANIL